MLLLLLVLLVLLLGFAVLFQQSSFFFCPTPPIHTGLLCFDLTQSFVAQWSRHVVDVFVACTIAIGPQIHIGGGGGGGIDGVVVVVVAAATAALRLKKNRHRI